MTGLSLDGVTKVYGNGHVAVDNVTFDVPGGELVVLVGPSGCGKTTILRLIAGLEKVTSGNVHFAGRRLNEIRAADRDIAMVFQNHAVYPHMRVFDNLSFGLRLQGVKSAEIDGRVRRAARLLEIESVLDRWPSQISGGQRQRVAIGRAIVREPQLFLFDEPLSNLDAQLRAQMRIELAALHRRLGTTTVYVTHDQLEAMTMGDRVVVLRRGEVQQVDTPSNIYRHPANSFVAGFIGSPGMNLIRGRISGNLFHHWKGGQEVLLPGSMAAGGEVLLGFRPEHLHLSRVNGLSLTGTVEAVETNGSDLFVYARWGEERIVARVAPGMPVPVGSNLTFGIGAEEIHLFDGKTGENLLLKKV